MMRRLLVLLPLAAALALPAAAGSTSTRTIRLGDEFGVKKSHILCAVENSKTLIPGQKLLACFIVAKTKSGPALNSYSVALAVDGEVALARVTATGLKTVKVWRPNGAQPAVSPTPSRQGTLYQVGVGTALLVKGTAITCGVNTQTFAGKSAVTVACFKVDRAKKPRPNTYGIGITDGGAFVVKFGADSKSTPVKIVQHGK